MTPFLTAPAALTTLILFGAVYTFIFSFGSFYINQLLRAGPAGSPIKPPLAAAPNRPMSLGDERPARRGSHLSAGE